MNPFSLPYPHAGFPPFYPFPVHTNQGSPKTLPMLWLSHTFNPYSQMGEPPYFHQNFEAFHYAQADVAKIQEDSPKQAVLKLEVAKILPELQVQQQSTLAKQQGKHKKIRKKHKIRVQYFDPSDAPLITSTHQFLVQVDGKIISNPNPKFTSRKPPYFNETKNWQQDDSPFIAKHNRTQIKYKLYFQDLIQKPITSTSLSSMNNSSPINMQSHSSLMDDEQSEQQKIVHNLKNKVSQVRQKKKIETQNISNGQDSKKSKNDQYLNKRIIDI